MTRICVRCKIRKPLKEFAVNGRWLKCYCILCWRAYQSDFRRNNKEKVAGYRLTDLLALKAKVDTLLGIKCRKCPFSDIRALVIDHVEDDGAAERKRWGRSKAALYRRIIANPAHYQRLCSNCNMIKEYERFNGTTGLQFKRINRPRETPVKNLDTRVTWNG